MVTKGRILTGLAVVGGLYLVYDLAASDTYLDRVLARNVKCKEGKHQHSDDNSIAHVFRTLDYNGVDRKNKFSIERDMRPALFWTKPNSNLTVGNLRIRIVESRTRDAFDNPGLILECPEYYVLEIYYNNKLVPGGSIDLALDLFNQSRYNPISHDNLTLRQILEKTDLGSKEVDSILEETLKLATEEVERRDLELKARYALKKVEQTETVQESNVEKFSEPMERRNSPQDTQKDLTCRVSGSDYYCGLQRGDTPFLLYKRFKSEYLEVAKGNEMNIYIYHKDGSNIDVIENKRGRFFDLKLSEGEVLVKVKK